MKYKVTVSVLNVVGPSNYNMCTLFLITASAAGPSINRVDNYEQKLFFSNLQCLQLLNLHVLITVLVIFGFRLHSFVSLERFEEKLWFEPVKYPKVMRNMQKFV